MALACAAPAEASRWPAAGGGPARSGRQVAEPGVLPAAVAWSFAGPEVRTAPVVTGGASPAAQRVAYGTADGRLRLRALDTGAEVGPPGGLQIADATLTDPGAAFQAGSGLASTSTEAAAGVLFAVHDDGGGVEIARVREDTGARVADDTVLGDSLGCDVAGAPLVTPAAADGSRLLFFTVSGACTIGPALIRVPVPANPAAPLGAPARAAVPGLVEGAAPALLILGAHYVVAVPRAGGLDLRRADGDFAGARDGAVELGSDPVALAAPETAPLATPALAVLTRTGSGTRLVRLDQGGDGRLREGATATLPGEPIGLAIGGGDAVSLAVATSTGLSAVRAADLGVDGTAPGSFGPPSAGGGLAFAAGPSGPVALRLADAHLESLPGPAVASVAPALARGGIAFGPVTLITTDATPPQVAFPAGARGLDPLVALAADDRGVIGVAFALDKTVVAVDADPDGSRFAPGARFEAVPDLSRIAPGAYTLTAAAFDAAKNPGRVARRVSVPCGRTVRGTRRADVLRGRAGRDCLYGGRGNDRIDTVGGGADRVTCGPGRDRVKVDSSDRLAADCERVRQRAK